MTQAMGFPPPLLQGYSRISLETSLLGSFSCHDNEKLLGKKGLHWTRWSVRNFPRIQIDLTAHLWILERKTATNGGLRSSLH